jgi:hypothetical protein
MDAFPDVQECSTNKHLLFRIFRLQSVNVEHFDIQSFYVEHFDVQSFDV